MGCREGVVKVFEIVAGYIAVLGADGVFIGDVDEAAEGELPGV